MIQSAETRRGSEEKVPGKSEGDESFLAIQGKLTFLENVK